MDKTLEQMAKSKQRVVVKLQKEITALRRENEKLKAEREETLKSESICRVRTAVAERFVERMKTQIYKIIAQLAHDDDDDFDDWLACMEETIRDAAEMLSESGTPYGCKCKTLHHRVTGDGCHICNPPESGEKGGA